MGVIVYIDTILVPISLFLTVGYHAYLWNTIKNKPSHTTIGMDKLRRTAWFVNLKKLGEDKKGMLAVQSLRNTLMAAILTATITILVNLALAALANNSYSASHLFKGAFFGTQSGRIFALKYGSASLFLVISFLCSSMAIGYLIDANFLMNAYGEFSSQLGYTQTILERGFTLALIGNRVLCITFPLLLWMLGPVPVMLASLALVWGLYELDFAAKFTIRDKPTDLTIEEKCIRV
ncbi:Protein of unknown function, DUF599 [Quillaja saponaria]|uniref:DUF599 domain-containing protein n=1 Tax=Quillaja saponaria TaxID=32244 RepID=A0AAD7LMW3_QUISA|nr:Protein of unknown function, DUF599 [Quillaja saponaria]